MDPFKDFVIELAVIIAVVFVGVIALWLALGQRRKDFYGVKSRSRPTQRN